MATIFTNGTYYRAGHGSRAASVGVEDGRIVAIGELTDIRSLVGPRAEEADLAGGMLSPGFCDAHLHPVMGGLERSQCDLGSAESAQECVELVAEYARANPGDGWIVGGGWRLDLFPGGTPTRQMLDAAAPGRAVLLRSADRHSSWASTRALHLAGITSATPDPADGRIVREADGRPSGTLREGAFALVHEVAPSPTPADLRRGLLVGQRHAFERGITGWQDALLRVADDGTDLLDAYLSTAADGTLRAKATGALWWDRTRGLEQLPELVERRQRAAAVSPRFRADSVKIMLDGVMENSTALLTAPYRDGHGHSTGDTGISFIPADELAEIVRAVDAAGFQAHFHALGDGAVRAALDALETLPGDADRRHHLAHLQVVQPDDVARFARVRATANIQPLWAQNEPTMTELTIPFLDPALVPLQYPFEDLRRAGARLAAGSDWPVTSADPILGIHVAVNRRAHGDTGSEPFLPAQALPLVSVWDAYTQGSAWVNRRERETGAIEVGLAADLVVIDRDPFAAPSDEIGAARVTSTWVDGERVWSA